MQGIHEKLQEAGLTGNESKVYVELLKSGELSANQAAKNLSLDRTLTYTLLNHLVDKGHASYIIKDNKKVFSANDPDSLLSSVKKKEAIIEDLIPKLRSITKVKETEYNIQVFEGKTGLRTMVNLALKEKKFCSFGATGGAYHKLYEMPRIAKEIKSKIQVRLIANRRLKDDESFAGFNVKFHEAESKSPVSVFGDYVTIHLTEREKPLLMMIKNKEVADTFKEYFEVLWKAAKKY